MSKTITIRLDDRVAEALAIEAESRGSSVAAVVRRAIEAELAGRTAPVAHQGRDDEIVDLLLWIVAILMRDGSSLSERIGKAVELAPQARQIIADRRAS